MAEEYPIPVFHFRVEWGGTRIGFTEVSGLNIENQVIEYREGNSNDYSPKKMPGMRKYPNITMKRGIFNDDNDYYKWLDEIKLNQVTRRQVTISLLDEEHSPVVTWSVKNAIPVKVDGPSLKSTENGFAIESLEIAHEGLKVENG